MRRAIWVSAILAGACALALAQPIRIGLDADMSSVDADVGQDLERGALLAIEELNASGGVLGRPLELTVRDHRRNPARGVSNVEAFAADPAVVAIIGGKHTPVILAELPAIHRHQIPYLIPWAAGTPLIDHGFEPSYTFRLSVRDAFVAPFLVERALERGYRRVGLVLEQTGWGRSNEEALVTALEAEGLDPVHTAWINWGQDDFGPVLEGLEAAAAEVLVFVGNPPEGVALVHDLAALPPERRLPIVSHWGLAGEAFAQEVQGQLDDIELEFVQTFSFYDPPVPNLAAELLGTYVERFLERPAASAQPSDVPAPVAFAHAYDLVHLLALAIERAGVADRAAVRDALERLPPHQGLVRRYDPAFTPDRHEALWPSDLRLARYRGLAIVPVNTTPP